MDIKRLKEIYEQEDTKTQAAKIYAAEKGLEYSDSFRRKVSKVLDSNKLDNDTETETNQYSNDKEKSEEPEVMNMPSAWDAELNRFLSIDEYCDKWGLPKEQVRSSKLVSHLQHHMIYNIAFNPTINEQTGIDEEFIEEIVKSHVLPVAPRYTKASNSPWVDRLVITDVHVGMSTEGGRNVEPLYDGKWDREELMRRLDLVNMHVVNHKKGDTIIIDELGDIVDGLFGQTTRKGHELPQNMSDKQAFEAAIAFMVSLADIMYELYDKVLFHVLTEDNHSGVFSYFVHSTVKKIVEAKYPNRVKYTIMEKFINHYSVGKHTKVLSHGKDSESLKFGFKPVLDAKQADKIDQYCKEHKLYNGNFLEFSKGDSHQFILDYTTSRDFNYFNYPAFSPPSNWVKSNFGKSRSGFVFQNIDLEQNIQVNIPYFFE